MTITIHWADDNQTILHFVFQAYWDWEEFDTAVQQSWQIMDTVNHTVDHIYDMSANSYFPFGGIHIIGDLRHKKHPRLNQMILVTSNPFFNGIYRLMERTYQKIGTNFQILPTLDDAYKELQRMRCASEGSVCFRSIHISTIIRSRNLLQK